MGWAADPAARAAPRCTAPAPRSACSRRFERRRRWRCVRVRPARLSDPDRCRAATAATTASDGARRGSGSRRSFARGPPAVGPGWTDSRAARTRAWTLASRSRRSPASCIHQARPFPLLPRELAWRAEGLRPDAGARGRPGPRHQEPRSLGACSRSEWNPLSRVKTTWSRTVMPRSRPASARRRVMSRSSVLGDGSPEGWL